MELSLSRTSNYLYTESEGVNDANTDEVQFVPRRAYNSSNSAQLDEFVFDRHRRSESCTLHGKSGNNVLNLNSNEDLSFAYDQALKREARLVDELSGKSAETEEIQEMFQYAIDFGQRLEQENQDLQTQLNEYVERNNSLQNINQGLENRNSVLMNSMKQLDEAESETRTALVRAKRESFRLAEDLKLQRKFSDELQQDYSDRIKSSIQDIAGQMKKEVELERFVRLQAEEQHSTADLQLKEKESALRNAMDKIKKLELTIKDKEDKYSRLLVELSNEKADLERKYEEKFTLMNEELAKHYDNMNELNDGDSDPFVADCILSFKESGALDTEILFLEKGDDVGDLFSPRSTCSLTSSDELRVQNTSRHGIFQEYLYVTTAAVKLHFPDLIEEVSSQELIEVVETSPFHLWYDLMTHYMRIIKRRNSAAQKPVQKKMIADQEVKSEKMSWIYRLFKRSNKIITTKARSTTVSKLKENSLELGMSKRAATFARTVRGDKTSEIGEMEGNMQGQNTLNNSKIVQQKSMVYSIVI